MKKINYGNFEANKRFLKELGILKKNQKILEIGSGKGTMVNYLLKKEFNIIGTEINPKWIKEAKNIYGKLPIHEMSGEELRFKDNSFDIVISFDVFEHIPNSNKHLFEVRRVLKSGGYYILQTPNKLTNIPWEILQSRNLFKWRKEHCSLQTRSQLKRRLEKHNFQVRFFDDIPIVNAFTINKVKKALGIFGVKLLKLTQSRYYPKSLRTNMYVLARKNE